jgi:hypothetical protein
VGPIDLVLDRGDQPVSIAFGDRAGPVQPRATTLCARRGFRLPEGEAWSFPELADLVSSMTVDVPSGDSELLLVYAGGVLSVLDREESDGMCEPMVHVGPIVMCADEPFVRVAEVRLEDRTAPDFDERVTVDVGPDGRGRPLDCAGQGDWGQPLLPPR